MTLRVGCVVEGEGEVEAVRVLLRGIAERLDPEVYLDLPRPIVVQRARVPDRFSDLEDAVDLAPRSAGVQGAVFVLLDSDGECPARLAPALGERVIAAGRGLPTALVLAHQEYESWFLAAADSLRGRRNLPADLEPPPNPEEIHGAKEWLRRRLPRGRKYSETADQPALTHALTQATNLELVRDRSASFDKCFRAVQRLLGELRGRQEPPSGTAGSETDS